MSRIEDEVCKKIQARSDVGKTKYGVTMETAPLSRLQWLIHAQEEAMDLAVYLQKLIEMEKDNEYGRRHSKVYRWYQERSRPSYFPSCCYRIVGEHLT